MCEESERTKPEDNKPCETGQVKPGECTPEQIAKCHPDAEGHPCEDEKEDA
jgi:hypothetical protein